MANSLKASVLVFVLLCLFPPSVNSQIVINEVLNNPVGEEKGAEWVELLNLSDSPKTLMDCSLYLDKDSETQKVLFSESDFIEKYKVISWDKSWLNNSGDEVRISCPDSSDRVIYGDSEGSMITAPSDGESFGRHPDGSGGFTILSSVTLGTANSPPPTNTPTHTVTPLPTPRPTATPKQQSTPTAVYKSLQPKSTPTVYLTPLVTSPPVVSKTDVLGDTQETFSAAEDFGQSFTPTIFERQGDVEVAGDTKIRVPYFALVLAIMGTLVIIFSLIPFLKKLPKKNER